MPLCASARVLGRSAGNVATTEKNGPKIWNESVLRECPTQPSKRRRSTVNKSPIVSSDAHWNVDTPRRRRASMCLCFPPWLCAACCGWRGVNAVGPPRDAETIARRRERRERRRSCRGKVACWHPTTEGRAGGELEMTPGESSGPAEMSSSIAEARTPPSVTAECTARVPAASDRTPVGAECVSAEEDGGDDDDARARATAGFRPLPLVAKDPRDPRDPNAQRRYGLVTPRRAGMGASGSTTSGAPSKEDAAVG